MTRAAAMNHTLEMSPPGDEYSRSRQMACGYTLIM